MHIGSQAISPSEVITTTFSVTTDNIRIVTDGHWTTRDVYMGYPHAVTLVDDEHLYRQLYQDLEVIGPK